MAEIKIILFASAREKIGADFIEMVVPEGIQLSQLQYLMSQRYPQLEKITGRWAVNREFVDTDSSVKSADEIAWIPPVSGG